MNIRYVPAHPNNYSLISTPKVGFVLHWIVGELEAADASFTNPYRRASAHYGIGSDGRIHQYVLDKYVAWHASSWEANKKYIGIEHAGGQPLPGRPANVGVDGRKKPTKECHQASVELITFLCQKHGIKKLVRGQNLWSHKEFVATACPGSLDINWIRDRVNENLSRTKPTSENQLKARMAQDLIKKLQQQQVILYNFDQNEDWSDNLRQLAEQGNWELFNTELASIVKMGQIERERRHNELAKLIIQDLAVKLDSLEINLYNYDVREDWADNLRYLAGKGHWELFNQELSSILKMVQNELAKG